MPDLSQPVLRAENLCVAIDTTEILHQLNFSVKSGEFLAIRGANGSGKTTLIRTILHMLPVTEGKLELFCKDVAHLCSEDWRKIGYAPQRVTAASAVPATALETVCAGLLYGNRIWKPKNWKAQAMAALELVGLQHRADESVATFSGGQQQRILIARAMVRKPQLLIFDEPFSGVDAASRNDIVDILATMRAQGTTIIAVLHDIYELEPLIDTTIFLEHGRIKQVEHTNFVPIDTSDRPTWQPHPPYALTGEELIDAAHNHFVAQNPTGGTE